MEQMVNMVMNNSIAVIIVALFLWDWVTNKKQVTDALKAISKSSINIEDCLKNLEKNNTNLQRSNDNISKSLDLLQQSLDNQDVKINRLLEHHKE